jgi:hypothetical protein
MARLTLKETMDRLLLLIRAGHPVIYIVSHEESRVLDYLTKIFRVIKSENPNKNLLRWYDTVGFHKLSPTFSYQVNWARFPKNEWEEFLQRFPMSKSVVEKGIKHSDEKEVYIDTEMISTEQKEEMGKEAVDIIHRHLFTWLNSEGIPGEAKWENLKNSDAFQALKEIKDADFDTCPDFGDSLTVFFDLHQGLGSNGSCVRPLRNAADELRRDYDNNRTRVGKHFKTIIIVAPSASGLSMELERDRIVVDFPLPETDELLLTLNQMIDREVLRFPDHIPPEEKQKVCGRDLKLESENGLEIYRSRLCDLIAGAGRGLTLEEYKRGLNIFAVSGQHLCARHIEEMLHLKAKTISNPALEYTPHVEINLGGLESVKKWVDLRRDPTTSPSIRKKYRLPSSKGVMLFGVSGGGKSQLAKLISKEFNLALLRLDVGSLFGRYVGEAEERTRQALQLAEVLAPVVLWIDELDKSFIGASSGGDSGVSARVIGFFLTWLAEKQDSVFVVATANDFSTLLNNFPELGRKGRFDEIFWIDLPSRENRMEIFRVYLKHHYEDRYLQLTKEDIDRLRNQENIQQQPPDGELLDQFCWLLSQTNISNNMTGAEIEYAITEALYNAYEFDRKSSQSQGFIPDTIVSSVKAIMNRALYHANSPDSTTLNNLRAIAQNKHWISVPGQKD